MKHFILSLALLCMACSTPLTQNFNARTMPAVLEGDTLITSDGQNLNLRRWWPAQAPRKIIIALHGMNDYSRSFELFGDYAKAHETGVIAYDQRGFGRSPQPGIWPGDENLQADLSDMIHATRAAYPQSKIYVLGVSMGGAVVINLFSKADSPLVEGIILAAPGLWGGDPLLELSRIPLWFLAHTVPGKTFTGEGLKIRASDNRQLLEQMWNDALVQKATRADSIAGVVETMSAAYGKLRHVKGPVLMLYGARDQVVLPQATARALAAAPDTITLAYYPMGYHLLLGDMQREVPYRDMLAWMEHPASPLPAQTENAARQWREQYTLAHPPILHSPKSAIKK